MLREILRPPMRTLFRPGYLGAGGGGGASYPPRIVAFYDSMFGDGTELRTGSEFVWSYADRDTPLIVDGKIVCDTAFTNELPSGAEDFTTGWINNSVDVADLGDGSYKLTNLGAGNHRVVSTWGVGEPQARSMMAKTVSGTGNVGLLQYNNNDGSGLTELTEEWPQITFVGAEPPGNGAGDDFFYGVDFRAGGTDLTEIIVKFPQATTSQYLHNYVPPATSQASSAGSASGNGASISMVEYVDGVPQPKAIAIKEALEGQCTLLWRGEPIGSDEIVLGEKFNCISTDDNADIPLYFGRDATGTYFAFHDGTNTAIVYATWDRKDDIIIVPTTSVDATTMRIGYMNVTQGDTVLTYSSSVAYTGSIPASSDGVRFGYEVLAPEDIQHVIVDNIGEDAEALLEQSKRYNK